MRTPEVQACGRDGGMGFGSLGERTAALFTASLHRSGDSFYLSAAESEKYGKFSGAAGTLVPSDHSQCSKTFHSVLSVNGSPDFSIKS